MSDLIRREDVINALSERAKSLRGDFGDLGGACSGAVKIIEALPSAEDEEFEWCHDCKEYDQKQHCCHQWSKVIRKTVEEIKANERTAKVMSIVLTSNPPQHVLKCGNCGGSIDKTYWRYCPHCGARLEWE